jgi:signal transduction histidine kinase
LKHRLIFKLLAINLVVIGFVMAVVWVSIDMLAAGYFAALMEKYHISPGPAHSMFLTAVHRYLLWASLAAIVLAVVLSFVMMRRVLGPMTRMAAITREIACGNFSARVPTETEDEVGQLAQAFNRMAESLQKVEKLRRGLIIDVAHELRTPLTNIRGYLEALTEGVLPPSPETLSLLQSETLRLVQLAEDVLQLARADAARGLLQPERFDLRAEVNAALETLSPAFLQKSLTVSLRAPEVPITVMADRPRIARVLRNLSDNAARYAPAGEDLEVRIEAFPGRARVTYANPAAELTQEDLPHIFERFYRGEKSRSRQHGGAGIGLAIVQELIEAHGGSVGADLAGGRVEIWFELSSDLPPADA